MRKIDRIVVHCAATTPDMDVGVKEIREWHLKRGFADVGYHYVIRRDGSIEKGRPDNIAGAHVEGYNRFSLGVCLVGGCRREGGKLVTENNFTPYQMDVLAELLKQLQGKYGQVEICGHRDLNKGKDCPSFSVKDFLIQRGWNRSWK